MFKEKTIETIGVGFKKKKVIVNENITIELHIWDFGGEEKYRTLFNSYCNGASAALILYDITNSDSMKDIENWVKIIDENALEDVVKILIGTKMDLEEKRVISKTAAKELSKKFNCIAEPIETSSKTGDNVEKAFLNVSRLIVFTHLQPCKNCGNVFLKKLKICNYCGNSVKVQIA